SPMPHTHTPRSARQIIRKVRLCRTAQQARRGLRRSIAKSGCAGPRSRPGGPCGGLLGVCRDLHRRARMRRMARSKVAVVRVRPDHVLEDIERLHALGGVDQALAAGATTILKDNISWHFPFPGANTTPW